MTDLFQSGLAVVSKSQMERISKESTIIRQYGLSVLADMLLELRERLERRRHEAEPKQEEGLLELFAKINQYLKNAIRQADLDEAGERIQSYENSF